MAGDRMWSVISRQIALINIIRATFWWLVSSAYVDITDWITTSFRYLSQDVFPWFDEFFSNFLQRFSWTWIKVFSREILHFITHLLEVSPIRWFDEIFLWMHFIWQNCSYLKWRNIVRLLTNELWKRETFYFIPYPQKSNA